MDSQGGSEKMMAGSNTTHKKRNTRMHMRLGPNTSWGAHTAPHPTPPQHTQAPSTAATASSWNVQQESKEVPAILRPWLA